MALNQDRPVVPPVATDKFLEDFAGLIQDNLRSLFGIAHNHLGKNDALTTNPLSTDGNPGDVVIGKVSGSIYIFVKLDRTHWYKFGPGTAL